MARQRRPYLPGALFHLAARTIRGERWLTPALRADALESLREGAERSDARVLAVAVMSNHLHVVLQQGNRPLAAFMQPALRRLAFCIQRRHGLAGPVFWRPYASVPCMNPTHARNAIAYTNLNPVRAGLCSDPADYPWTSHRLYAEPPPGAPAAAIHRLRGVVDVAAGLPLFARAPARSAAELRLDYEAFITWRLAADAHREGDVSGAGIAGRPDGDDDPRAGPPDPPPAPLWGPALDPLFGFTPPSGQADQGPGARGPSLDASSFIRVVLTAEAPHLAPGAVRGRGGSRELIRIRHLLIRRLHGAGYRNGDIARSLDLSPSAISYVLRRPPIEPGGPW